jgi:uncharacterized protein (DUF2237 family)
MTGFYRDGYCHTGPDDLGTHTVCAEMTSDFLDFTKKKGNDLTRPASNFPGLRPGDKWCLCAGRWKEANQADKAPPVYLGASNQKTLQHVNRKTLVAKKKKPSGK